MKFSLTFFALFLALKGVALAKVVMIDDRVFLRHDGRQIPVFLVNDLIDRGKIKKVNLFGEGRLHLISFEEKGEKEKLYSIDDQGFIYAIQPFAGYRVQTVTDNGQFQFRELPGKSFRITEKGFFIH